MFWFIALLVIGVIIVATFTSPPAKRVEQVGPDDDLPDELNGAQVDAETLARIGSPGTVADLVAEGRGDELRGLGYRGELPSER